MVISKETRRKLSDRYNIQGRYSAWGNLECDGKNIEYVSQDPDSFYGYEQYIIEDKKTGAIIFDSESGWDLIAAYCDLAREIEKEGSLERRSDAE